MPWIEGVFVADDQVAVDVLQQPVRMQIQRMGRLRGWVGSLMHMVGHNPRMHIHIGTGICVVGLRNKVCERVERGRDILALRLEFRSVKGIPTTAHLRHNHVHLPGPHIAHHLGNVGRCPQLATPCIHPEPSVFRHLSPGVAPPGHQQDQDNQPSPCAGNPALKSPPDRKPW